MEIKRPLFLELNKTKVCRDMAKNVLVAFDSMLLDFNSKKPTYDGSDEEMEEICCCI